MPCLRVLRSAEAQPHKEEQEQEQEQEQEEEEEEQEQEEESLRIRGVRGMCGAVLESRPGGNSGTPGRDLGTRAR